MNFKSWGVYLSFHKRFKFVVYVFGLHQSIYILHDQSNCQGMCRLRIKCLSERLKLGGSFFAPPFLTYGPILSLLPVNENSLLQGLKCFLA